MNYECERTWWIITIAQVYKITTAWQQHIQNLYFVSKHRGGTQRIFLFEINLITTNPLVLQMFARLPPPPFQAPYPPGWTY